MQKKKLLKRFRIRLEPKRKEYYDVLIYSSQKWMRDRFKEISEGKWSAYGWDAITVIMDCYEGRKKTPKIGEILMCTDELDNEVIAHELAHAVNWYVNNLGWDWNMGEKLRGHSDERWIRNDERYARIMGRVTSQFMKKWVK